MEIFFEEILSVLGGQIPPARYSFDIIKEKILNNEILENEYVIVEFENNDKIVLNLDNLENIKKRINEVIGFYIESENIIEQYNPEISITFKKR